MPVTLKPPVINDKTPTPKNNTISLFVDASFTKDKIGVGLFFDAKNLKHLNRSQVYPRGSRHSTKGELMALMNAVWFILNWKGYKNQSILLSSDSEFAVEYANGNRNKDAFLEERLILANLLLLCNVRGIHVEIQHVPREKNKQADKLSKDASRGRTNNLLKLPSLPTTRLLLHRAMIGQKKSMTP